MRTLVVSDLHLGARDGRALLSDVGGEAMRALTDALADADRLVLLGDVLELRQGPVGEAVDAARPALERIAAGLSPEAPVVLVTGNHDHGLIVPWLGRRDPDEPLGVAASVTPAAAEPLAAVVEALGARRTAVAHPGAWLRDDVWATHGHYADVHSTVPMLERIGAGVMARVAGRSGRSGRAGAGALARAEDYEAVLGPLYAWLDALAQDGTRPRSGGGGSARAWGTLAHPPPGVAPAALRARALALGFPVAIAALNRLGIGPLSADLSGGAVRRGPLRAMGEVVARLGVDAPFVVFGHTHRAGPLPGDDAGAEWRTAAGARLHNVGCWVREDVLAGPDPSRSPYRPGFAAWVDAEPGSPPALVNLLDRR